MPNTIIIGINSDIGTHLARRFTKDGHTVLGTYRSKPAPIEAPQIQFDISNYGGILELNEFVNEDMGKWDNLIFCVGNPLPLTPFLDTRYTEWLESFQVNGPKQLELFNNLFRHYAGKNPNVCFLSAGGVNSCPTEFSAYTLGKTFLVKACELIAAEEPDLNIFTYGPGWVPTKTHRLMIDALPDGERKKQIKEYMQNAPDIGKVMDEIYQDIMLLCEHREASGKNFARGNVPIRLNSEKYYPNSGKLRISI